MAYNLMIQGTMSGAGKSILTAGILRVMRQDGYRAAPFKSQNMALNSFITKEGLEMGRAQVVQAQAAGLAPSADMNPILLKPMGDTTSQVIVGGRPIGSMKAKDYFARKMDLVPDILRAYHHLEECADIIVIEGAGSPVEINLRDRDIVNMGLAELVDAPVLLVGNIDPGGVFAQLLGTLNLLSQKERDRVKGLIINKFRGDIHLLGPGLEMFRSYSDIPFAGVVPYTPLDLEEEDSMSERLMNRRALPGDDSGPCVEIAVIRLPYISNYSDFTPLEHTPGVKVRYVSSAEKLCVPDLIIIPGTKNTIGDLLYLKSSGLAEKIQALYQKKICPVLGICGGYQMLGQSVSDQEGAEHEGTVEGLGILPVRTLFHADKRTRQSSGKTAELPGFWKPMSDLDVEGYEIHMGQTVRAGDSTMKPSSVTGSGLEFGEQTNEKGQSFILSEGGGSDGCVTDLALGTYYHGIFDSPNFRNSLLAELFRRKGLEAPAFPEEDEFVYQEKQLDHLADVLREHLDFDLIYRAVFQKN